MSLSSVPLSITDRVQYKVQVRVWLRDGRCCRYCAWRHSDPGRFELDHVVPRSLGGPSTVENLVVSCARCNRLKGDAIWMPMSVREAHLLSRPLSKQGVLRSQRQARFRTHPTGEVR